MPPVAPENLILFKFFLILIYFVQLPFAGFMIGGSLVAILLDIYGRIGRSADFCRFGNELLARATQKKSSALLLLLAVAVNLVCARLSYPQATLPGGYAAAVLIPLAAGLSLLYLHRFGALGQGSASPFSLTLGLGGLGAMLAGYFLLFFGAALLVMPDEWPHLHHLPGLLLSWNGVWKFAGFLALAFATSGAAILLIGASASRRPAEDPAYQRFIERTGAGLALTFLLAWPLFLLLDLYTLPRAALSGDLFVVAGAGLVLALATCFLLLMSLENRRRSFAQAVLTGCLAIFLAWILTDHLARETALSEPTLAGGELMRTAFRVSEPKAVEPPPAAQPVKEAVAAGQAVFESVCAGCHRFDQRVVGPPLNAVLGKYRGDLDGLKAFIRNPAKINPDYPQMPSLGLGEERLDAVARYLLDKAPN